VGASELLTYAEALAQYHLRPESKFLNGDFHIGKEANVRMQQPRGRNREALYGGYT
jgi:hypothetical protein